MSREIFGNSYRYIIDESYGINKDGLIAIGTESIVYKGLKTRAGGGLQFSCVLKFKPKKQIIDGKVIDRLQCFKNEEWKIFEDLRECRSVVRIDDVIDDLGDFDLPCTYISAGVINSAAYFCVVEEFIDGWNLSEFCREEFWKLRKYEPIANGLQVKIEYNEFSADDKRAIALTYNYDNQLKFQNQILLFMINLCEIMQFVTEQKNILHLDIKPENIMVTRYGKELVLIDFGRSRTITKANRFAKNDLLPVDYNNCETQEKQYEYGTLGYAAPECFCKPANGSKYPVSPISEQGMMSIESDIFSFGATFWECLNMFELVTKALNANFDMYDFYKDNIINDLAYCNRDLSLTADVYHQKLERIIKKCTRNRTDDYLTSDRYYHSYKELKKDIELAKDSCPTIIKEEDVKVKTAFKLSGVMLALALVFCIINSIYHVQAYKIAENKWDSITADYNETQFSKLSVIAKDYLSSAANRTDSTYDKIVKFTYQNNGSISSYEAEMLVELLLQMDDSSKLAGRIDEIMLHADISGFKAISGEIVKLDVNDECTGYELAVAIYNVEVGKSNIVEAYDTLTKYKNNEEFKAAEIKLKNVLDNDDSVKEIMQAKNLTRQQILDFFNSFEK